MKHGIYGKVRKGRRYGRPMQSRGAIETATLSALLESVAHDVVNLQENATAFAQGDLADAVYFLQTGKVKITVVSKGGNEAVLGIFGPLTLLGEGCLVDQPVRVTSATAMEPSTLFRIKKPKMLQALLALPRLSEKFTASVLSRSNDLEEDLCDQLFNHSEKRLARVLLKLARFGLNDNQPIAKMPPVNHETLGEMVGTTRSRVSFFMSKFRRLGLIDYKTGGEITVKAQLLTDILLKD